MATWNLEPTRETLHGHFSRDLKPVLTIEPGDKVHFRTLDARWYIEEHASIESPEPRKFEPKVPDLDSGHALVGPVFVNGAQPGMALEIQVDEIRVGSWGWTAAGFKHPNNERLRISDQFTYHLWKLDAAAGTGTNQFGHQVTLRPFMGVMGMPPDEAGILQTGPPRTCGGNLDCKELVAGTSLFLPIEVEGGLFSTGDGHALQGDGEVCVTAIECPMDRATLTFRLHESLKLPGPRIKTRTAWITLGIHTDLQEATYLALEHMLDLMGEVYGLKRMDAMILASLVVDMRITQIANGVQGVHAVLPLDAIHFPKS